MNRKKLYLYICISLVVGTQVTFHKNIAYAYYNKDFNRITTVNQKLNSTNLVSYTIDDSWIVIDSAATSEKSLNKVISDYIKDGKTKFYIKNGEYILDDGIIINSPGVIIQGESKENTRIIQNNSAINAITVTEDNAEISNLTIDSTQGRIAFSTSDDKKINKVNLHDCIIKGSPNVFAVAFYGTPYTNDVDDNNVVENNNLASGNIIENNEIYSESSGLEKDGILFTKQKNGLINNNKIYGRRIAFYLSRDSKVTNNKIYDSSTNGIRCTVPAYYNEISGNTIDNPKASGICLVKNNGEVFEDYRASNITIKNNSISNSKYFGIEINNLEDSEISSNALSKIGFNGIYLISSNELNIHDNTIDNCNLFHGSDWEWDPALNSGILLDYNVKNSTLKSNTIKNDSDTCPYGINILPGRSNTYNAIINNTIEGYFIKGIDAQSKDPENTVVSANILNLIPGDLKAKTLDKNKIQLNWNNVYPVEGYNIYRSNSENGNYSKVNTSPVISNGYIDMELEPGKTYYYKIAAVSQEGEEWTSSLSVSAETWPEAPIGLAAKSLDKSTIKLQWENIPGIERYNIYRSDSETGEYQKIEANVTSNTYIDTDLEAGMPCTVQKVTTFTEPKVIMVNT